MASKYLIGMWRYAITKKLRKNMNRISSLRLSFKLDANHQEWRLNCGCDLRVDCPFYCKIKKVPELEKNVTHMCNHLCLSPAYDIEWSSFQEESYKKKWNTQVVGCFILSYCERGYENYLRLKAWQRRTRY